MKPTIAFRVEERTMAKIEELCKLTGKNKTDLIIWLIDMAFFVEKGVQTKETMFADSKENVK
jgi:phage antirepressor YoqD-like protein